MRYFVYLSVLAGLSVCAASSAYSVEAYGSNGKLLSKRTDFDSNKEGIEIARSTLCKTYPNAVIKVSNNITGKEVEQTKCR